MIKFIYIVLVVVLIFGCGDKKAEKKPTAKQPAAKVEAPKEKEEVKEEVKKELKELKEIPKPPEEGFTYNPRGRRDPFRSLILPEREKAAKAGEGLPPLQRIDSADLKLTGIIWDQTSYIAMVETPEGKDFVIREGTVVGLNKGIVKKITQRNLIIEEKIKTYLGEARTREVTLELRKKEGE